MSVPAAEAPGARRAPSAGEPVTPAAAGLGRLMSLDALRGFDMFWIVGAGALVNACSALSDTALTRFLKAQLTHVQWAGFHFYDLVFPLFVFISGVSLVFSTDRAVAQHGPLRAWLRLARRCLTLFLLGIFFYGGLQGRWADIRLLGVLQYIGLTCLGAGTVYILVRRAKALAAVCAALLLGYWALMAFVPFPDVRLDAASLAKAEALAGSREPAKVLATAPGRVRGHYEEGYNLANHLEYRFLPGKKVNGAYENQSLLGSMCAVTSCLLGVLAGLWLRRQDVSDTRKALGMLAAGAAGVALGLVWGLEFPVIKKLWSPSFTLLVGGLSAALLGVFYWVVDIRNKRLWCQPFVWIGMNPITLYLAHNVIHFPKVAQRLAGGDFALFLDAHVAKGAGSVVLAAVQLALTFLLVRFLYVRKIFIRI